MRNRPTLRLYWPSRRRTLAAFATLGTLLLPLRSRAATLATPALTEGPYYPERFADQPTRSLVLGPQQGVQRLQLSGRVVRTDGPTVPGARIEIWQCDALGHYHHSRDSRPEERDPGFAGYGWALADAQGAYLFDTIRPVPYPGRTPHIHLAVVVGGRRQLVTQIFIAGDPGNAGDFLYRRMSAVARERVTMPVTPTGHGTLAGHFEVVLTA
ncbi:MAG: intradiol ring-cleavage dioxygenase [Burkholderiaceae bacterium]